MKSWITPRTRAKVEIYSQRTQWEPRISELVHVNELPSDYGGNGTPTHVLLEQQTHEEGVLRQYVYTLTVCKSAKTGNMELKEGEDMELFVLTRSLREGVFFFCFKSGDHINKALMASPWVAKHHGKGLEEENPTRVTLSHRVKGPCNFHLKVNCDTGAWSSESFLVGAKVRNIESENRENIQPAENDVKSMSQSKLGSKNLNARSNKTFDNDFIVSPARHNRFPVHVKKTNVKKQPDDASSTSSSQSSFHILEKNSASPHNDFFYGCLGWSCGAFWK
jgi:hypothetical protein